jgi:hypothetical protein
MLALDGRVMTELARTGSLTTTRLREPIGGNRALQAEFTMMQLGRARMTRERLQLASAGELL